MELYRIITNRGIYKYYRSKDTFERGWKHHLAYQLQAVSGGYGTVGGLKGSKIGVVNNKAVWKQIRTA